jgi:hypothetical protein
VFEELGMFEKQGVSRNGSAMVCFINVDACVHGVQGYKQIVECRRILKWSYAYAYYVFDTLSLPEDEKEKIKDMTARKDFFEHLQGRAERELELLSKAIEVDCCQFGSPVVNRAPGPDSPGDDAQVRLQFPS